MSSKVEIKKSVCMWCKGECGVLVKVQNGHLISMEQDPDYPRRPFPALSACPRARRAVEYVYHPDRVRFPLKRAGERGENKWQRITWKQAFDEIAQKIAELKEKYGAECISGTFGTIRTHWEYQMRFFNILGSPNLTGSAFICTGPRQATGHTICGNFSFYSAGPKTRCILLLGIEPYPARPSSYYDIRQALKNGAKLIVVDPRRTNTASRADLWLQIRHGTDLALLMAMINIIINEERYDREFVSKWTYGFDKLRERVSPYTPKKAAEITGIPAEKIIEAARMYADNKPGTIMEGEGEEHQTANFYVLQARWILSALVGNIDVEGGDEFRPHNPSKVISNRELEARELMPPGQGEKQIISDRFRLFSWMGREKIQEAMMKSWGKSSPAAFSFAHTPMVFRSILTGKPYPTRALLMQNNNVMLAHPNTKMVYKALKSDTLELHVTLDLFLTPTAQLSDYFLPTTCWIERPLLTQPHSDCEFMTAGEAALPHTIPGEYEYKREYDIYRELGIRLGQEKYWPWPTLEEAFDYRLAPEGYTHKEYVDKVRIFIPSPQFKKYEQSGFGTPSGKVEFYSNIAEMLGNDPLPEFEEPFETPVSRPDLAKEYPLTLITGGRIVEYYHSEWRQIDSLRQKYPYPLLQIHPETAHSLGISEGDWVWIESPRGRVRMKATLFDGIQPNVVHGQHSWWYPELPGEEPWLHGVWESNINVLTEDNPDICGPVIGAWPLKTCLCKVYKVKQY